MKIGLAQISPVWLRRKETVAKIAKWVGRAADEGCDLVAFGESLVPGYPFWLSSTDGARFNSDIQKELYSHYLDQAVVVARGDLEPVCIAARQRGIAVMLGCFERATDRGAHTGYCSLVTIDRAGAILNVHRKVMPTYEERLVWGTGDGHGLRTFNHAGFCIGGLNCWENWMPLLRSSLYGQGESLRVAVWPGGPQNTRDITRFVAMEGRSYVASVSGVMTHNAISDELPHAELLREKCPPMMAAGGSCIAGPDGEWIAPPADDQEQLITATLDPAFVRRERQNFDPSGHYSRPDITRLHVDRRRQSVLSLTDEHPPG
ncbi:MAG: carbon-nitrogen hydrolase family protein [Planctomycetota bacterium]